MDPMQLERPSVAYCRRWSGTFTFTYFICSRYNLEMKWLYKTIVFGVGQQYLWKLTCWWCYNEDIYQILICGEADKVVFKELYKNSLFKRQFSLSLAFFQFQLCNSFWFILLYELIIVQCLPWELGHITIWLVDFSSGVM